MKFAFIRDLETHLATEFDVPSVDVTIDLCPEHFDGDVTVNCFVLARQLRRPPPMIAEAVREYLSSHAAVVSATCIKAFVNVVIEPRALFTDTVADAESLLADGEVSPEQRQKVLIEYSAPNTNKPLHLGHVRNNCIGMALAALLKRVGHGVVTVNLINDRGTHICKSMLAYQRWGDGKTPESTGTKGDHFVGEYYVRFDRELGKQLSELRAARPDLEESSNEELFLQAELGRSAQDMLVAWEDGDADVRTLWETMNRWVVAGFEATYARMGVQFDRVYVESDTYTLGKDIVEEGLEKGVFRQLDDSAIVIDLEDEKLGTKVVLRSDGTSVHVTQDIGTTLMKQDEFQPDRQVWVVADEQIYHFRVLFAILRALGYPWAEKLVHMAYGMVNLPSGKMKSREGTVVDADDLFDELEELARAATLERSGPDVPADLERRAKVISTGALKFMLLKVNSKTTMTFDPAASIKFEGDTGPYVQYAYARISSMVRKAGDAASEGTVDWGLLDTVEEKELGLRCGLYGEALRRAAAELDTSGLVTYLLDLAKAFSRFYQACPVLAAPTPELRRARLALSDRVRSVLRDGLSALTIDTLESM